MSDGKINLEEEKTPKLQCITQYSLKMHTCCYKGITALENM